jgi:hypothetical protein
MLSKGVTRVQVRVLAKTQVTKTHWLNKAIVINLFFNILAGELQLQTGRNFSSTCP